MVKVQLYLPHNISKLVFLLEHKAPGKADSAAECRDLYGANHPSVPASVLAMPSLASGCL